MTLSMMHRSLPPLLRRWVAERAAAMGLPEADDYILLLIRLEKQRLELEPADPSRELMDS